MGLEQTPETSHISTAPQTMDSVQRSVPVKFSKTLVSAFKCTCPYCLDVQHWHLHLRENVVFLKAALFCYYKTRIN
jgi:hypothetical protein